MEAILGLKTGKTLVFEWKRQYRIISSEKLFIYIFSLFIAAGKCRVRNERKFGVFTVFLYILLNNNLDRVVLYWDSLRKPI